MTIPEKSNNKIIIRDLTFNEERFKPQPFEESELPGILDALTEVSHLANRHVNPDSLVNNSPLLYIEGLLRYQIMRIEEDLGLTLAQLQTISDFLHERDYVHNYVSSSKAVFLFDFLNDIVFFSYNPELIDPAALEKIAQNLRGLSFLVESQLTGGEKDNNDAFEVFAYAVWLKIGAKKISAVQFWNKAVSRLADDELKDVEIPIQVITPYGVEKTESYLIQLGENKAGKTTIKAVNIATDKPAGKAKSLKRMETIWKPLQNKFIKKMR